MNEWLLFSTNIDYVTNVSFKHSDASLRHMSRGLGVIWLKHLGLGLTVVPEHHLGLEGVWKT